MFLLKSLKNSSVLAALLVTTSGTLVYAATADEAEDTYDDEVVEKRAVPIVMTQPAPSSAQRFSSVLRTELGGKYPGARIEISGDVHWTSGGLPTDPGPVSLRGETARGEVMFAVSSLTTHHESLGWATYAAWMPTLVATRRVRIGEKIEPASFVSQEVNVASGPARDYRGILIAPGASLNRLEARQTVLEGGFLTTTAVIKVPDVRRGDAVRVNLISNGLSLVTQGLAEEPAYLDGQIRVKAGRTKRELVGKLINASTVEVKL